MQSGCAEPGQICGRFRAEVFQGVEAPVFTGDGGEVSGAMVAAGGEAIVEIFRDSGGEGECFTWNTRVWRKFSPGVRQGLWLNIPARNSGSNWVFCVFGKLRSYNYWIPKILAETPCVTVRFYWPVAVTVRFREVCDAFVVELLLAKRISGG